MKTASQNIISSFESPLVVSYWDKKIGKWRSIFAFFNYLSISILSMVLFAEDFNFEAVWKQDWYRFFLLLTCVTGPTSIIFYYLTNKTEIKGAMKVYHDRILLVGTISDQEIRYDEVDEIRFERHSDYHRPAGYEVSKKHGNKLIIYRHNMKSEFEFLLKSATESAQFHDFMMDLRQKWPSKIFYTSV